MLPHSLCHPRVGSESNPYLATANADPFNGSGSRDWVSYANSNEGVNIDLNNNPATVSKGWAEGDTLSGIDNLIGSRHVDTLSGNSGPNTLRGGLDNDIGSTVEGATTSLRAEWVTTSSTAARATISWKVGQDKTTMSLTLTTVMTRFVPTTDGGRLLFPNGGETDTFYLARDENGVTVATAEGGSTFIHIADRCLSAWGLQHLCWIRSRRYFDFGRPYTCWR